MKENKVLELAKYFVVEIIAFCKANKFSSVILKKYEKIR